MTVTSNEYGQQNIFAKEPQMVVEDYNKKGSSLPCNSVRCITVAGQ